jgi:hypothetical protein
MFGTFVDVLGLAEETCRKGFKVRGSRQTDSKALECGALGMIGKEPWHFEGSLFMAWSL